MRALVGFNEMADAVFLPAFLVAFGAEGPLLAQAGRGHSVGGDAEGDEVALDGGGAAVAEDKVVFGGAAFVAVALDSYSDLRILTQEVGGLGESVVGIVADVGFVEVEVGIPHFLKED